MDKRDVVANLVNVEALFDNGKYEAAVDLFQECINTSRLESKQFMERLRDSTKDSEVLDKLQYMYFMNFV